MSTIPIFDGPRVRSLDEVRRDYTTAVLVQCGGDKTRAAAVIGVDRTTVAVWLKRWAEADRRAAAGANGGATQ